ncbi:TonB-dependent receptor plug domain-containing protein [Flavitalea sp.]|nr:TonB-dependent receptor plug domain-containing protein [Flavitalea sp.]
MSTIFFIPSFVAGQEKDTAATLQTVTISAEGKPQLFKSITPVQAFDKKQLDNINAYSVGDAARYFSGVLIKDYGGTGGLKTISVRSLGAAHTGILYDGIPVSDQQTGQIDLSRFSTTFIQSLQLHQAGIQETLVPARAAAAGTTVAIESNTFDLNRSGKTGWQTGIKAGSFEHIQPFAGLYLPLNDRLVLSGNIEATYSTGNYPVVVDNGNLSYKSERNNSFVRSIQSEANLVYIFSDSSNWQTKFGSYFSERGLPGAIVFFNDRSVQQLANSDVYAQTRFKLKPGFRTNIIVSAKYQYNKTLYSDPDYPNNQGGLKNNYRQQEIYLSAVASHRAGNNLVISASSDFANTTLKANTGNYNAPKRIAAWNNISLNYHRGVWQLNTSVLHNYIADKTDNAATLYRNEFTPAVALSVKTRKDGPLMFRAFYKKLFRMPTFNDLYYNLVGNRSLKPEFADHYNLGVSFAKSYNGAIKKLGLSLDAYHLRVKDKIVAVPNRNLFVWTMLNLGVVNINGIDLTTELDGKLSHEINWFTRVAYTWQKALDKTDPASTTYKNRIPYTPDHSGSAMLSFGYRQWMAGPSLLFSGKRFTLGENNPFNEINGWITCDVFVSKKFRLAGSGITAKVEINNINDARYDVVRYYPMPGRSYKIILTLNNL